MITVTFQVKPYLAAYMYTRYKNHLDLPPDRSSSALSTIHLPDTQPIYHFLHQLSTPHPPNASWHETGNITFTLPHPRNGKNPNVYNYIGHDSALIIEKAMEVEMKAAFSESDQEISGFRISRKAYVENQHINIGDKFICYCTKIQRFIGILEITSNFFIDSEPIFTQEDDPFILRFNVKPIAWLPLEKGIPIHENIIWNHLSFTQKLSSDSTRWTYMVFSSPRLWPKEDCEYLEQIILQQRVENERLSFIRG